jgi:hypothetical protein
VCGSQLHHAIQLWTADLVVIAEALMGLQKNGAQSGGIPLLEERGSPQYTCVFVDDMPQARRPAGVEFEHVQADITKVTHGIAPMEGHQSLGAVSDAIGILGIGQAPGHARVQDHPAESFESRWDVSDSQVSEVDLKDTTGLGEE